MTTAAEATGAKSELAADIAAGVAALSGGATVTFTQYARVVLPLDGFVFWVRADLLTAPAFANILPAMPIPTAAIVQIAGSMHYSITKQQNEDETVAINQVVFTGTSEVNDLDRIGPNSMLIAEVGPEAIPFAFSQRGRYYAQADLYHYVGDAVYPALQSQIIDSAVGFNAQSLVVSNSLPIWLALNSYTPPYPGFVTGVTLYPSFAVPDNLVPPYGTVHIEAGETRGLQAAPYFGPTLSRYQLSRDRVKVTLYGLGNDAAMTFLDAVFQYSFDYSTIGLSNMPVIRDDKRTQRELSILAMKKTVEFEVTYLQTSVRDIARQTILFTIQGYALQPAVFAA